MNEENRPDPDVLLAAVKRREQKSRSGRLRIFFGMAAGVGKTYAMLKAAQGLVKDGVDLVVGVIETHNRAETQALLEGLTIVPRKELEYKGAKLSEMDIDAIVARHPQLVLVDELAHTNAPGSRHGKRWQDVVELLDAGIDVYTTLNVQHIESRKESVEGITGIIIHETVPDSIFERATQFELIDITPAELLKRLNEGKVYLGANADRALQNFFKEDRLTALREIALRFAAETVDFELQGLTSERESEAVWKPTERLMVAVSHSPFSEGLVRATRRLAFSLEAPWIGVHVDSGLTLQDQEKLSLARNLELVRELGGEIIATADPDIATALDRVARQRGVTQLVVGRPTRRWYKVLLGRGSLVDQLIGKTGSFDIHVLRPDEPGKVKSAPKPFSFSTPLSEFLITVATVGVVALICGALSPFLGYKTIGFVFLLTVLTLSLFVSIIPILLGAAISALIWDFFFIPPHGTISITHPEDIVMCVAYFVAAVITGTLTHRIRSREKMIRLREERTEALYEIVQSIISAQNLQQCISMVTDRLGKILNGELEVLLKGDAGELARPTGVGALWLSPEKEWAVAKWSFANNKIAGWTTDTLPGAEAMYLPLHGPSESVGILALKPKERGRMLQEELSFLNTAARQLAIAIEREMLQEKSRTTQQLKESERLHQTILDSVSHEIRTPITAIIGSASALDSDKVKDNADLRTQLTHELTEAAERLNLVVENLLDTSRLGTGNLQLNKEWHEVQDLISITLKRLKRALSQHRVTMTIPDNLPLIMIDFRLFEQALSNLIRNAAAYSPNASEITIAVTVSRVAIKFGVLDQGPGIPVTSLPHIFERFYRVPGSPAGGTGLGLWLAKNIVEAHGGTIEAQNRPTGGAAFVVSLPIKNQPTVPAENDTNL